MSKSLLAISAHPDDIEFGCGGTMFKFKDNGYDIYMVVATNGENGFKIEHRSRKERIKVRRAEQMEAAKFLGVKKVFYLNYRDCYLKNDHRLRDRIALIIKKVKPEIVFSFDPGFHAFENINLNHTDHRAVAEAAFDAVFAARNRYILPGKTHAVKQIYFYITEKPNHYENITRYINKKIELSGKHRSQYNDKNTLSSWLKKYLSSYTKKFRYSESFRIVDIKTPFRGIKQ